MLKPVVRPASLTDLAYSQLREGVLSGGLLNGGRVSVVALAEQLGMSRSPVRSAVERRHDTRSGSRGFSNQCAQTWAAVQRAALARFDEGFEPQGYHAAAG